MWFVRAVFRLFRKLKLWQQALLVCLTPLLMLNLSVAFFGQSVVSPLSPFFLEEKAEALGAYFRHRPTCVLHGHPDLPQIAREAERKAKLPAGIMQAIVSGDARDFYEREIGEREKALLPPFGRLASVIVSADSRVEAETHARGLRQAAPAVSGVAILGPAEAPLALIRGRHRFRLLVHGQRSSDMQAYLRAMIANGPKERGSILVQVDIDPQSFF